MEKLKNQFTINTDQETAELIKRVAEYYQRKPAELLRLLLVPALFDEWTKIQTQQHPENRSAFIRL